MDIFYKHQIDHRPHIIILYRNQPFQTSAININEQTSESLPTETLNDANKQAEPIVLHKHLSKDQRSDIQYVMKTTFSYISFLITNPTSISVQLDPFTITLKTYRRNHAKQYRKTHFILNGLQVLQKSNAYIYFRPSLDYKHIFLEGPVKCQHNIILRLTDTAKGHPIHICKNTQVGTLQPVLLSKYLKTTDNNYRQPPLTSTIC